MVKKITVSNETELYDAVHELSMSTDPKEAAFGRGLKLFIPTVDKFIAEERERGTAGENVLHALVHVAAQTLGAAAQSMAKPGHTKNLMLVIAKETVHILKSHVEEAAEIDNQNKAQKENAQQLINLCESIITKSKQQEGTTSES